MNTIKIRKMHKKDIDQIMKIESVSFGNFYWTREAFATEIENNIGYYFVAEAENEQIIGYCGFWLILDEAHVTTIAVHPKYRKQGLGEKLLQKMLETGYEKEAKWFTLEVRASNVSAQNLYYKYKFKSLGLRRKYYQDNEEDAMIMWTENIWESSFRDHLKNLKNDLEKRVKV
ncbi:MAG TPA: ribosomal protein S18-alanine N-acetyltransferase [Candidatus Gastranaerophilales bacterium]|nr:ribosomal protein S18-alanine N-acetyltransferase [Candidatus Gastranaerophilales bacterium]